MIFITSFEETERGQNLLKVLMLDGEEH